MQTIYIVVQSFSNPHGVRTTPIWPTFFFLRHLRHSYLTKYDRMIECAHEKQEKQEHITTRPFVELRIVHFNCCHLWVNLPLELEQIRLLGSCQAWEMKFAAEWHWKRATMSHACSNSSQRMGFNMTQRAVQHNTGNSGMASMASASDTAHLKGCSDFPLHAGHLSTSESDLYASHRYIGISLKLSSASSMKIMKLSETSLSETFWDQDIVVYDAISYS